MSTQTIEQTIVNRERLHRVIDAFPDRFAQKLNDYMEELIDELEEEEDIAYLESLSPEERDPANGIPLEEVIAEYEAEFGPLDDDDDDEN